MKVSIVMPVYNASLYLAEAIESIIHQTHKDLEVICVDDGSTDDSLSILEKYQTSDNRLKIIKQNNMYAGTARNAGLKIATGEYIMFLDSDDVFEKDMVSYLVRKAEKTKPDIIVFGYWRFSDNLKKKHYVRNQYTNNTTVSSYEIRDSIFQQCRTMPWDKFIKLEFIRDSRILYKQTRVNNDIYFNQMIVTEANSILFCTKRLVHYRVNNKKSLQGNLNKYPTEFINAFSDVKKELISRGRFELFEDSYNRRISEDIFIHLQRIQSYDEFKIIVESLSKSNLLENIEDFNGSKYYDTFRLIHDGNTEESLANLFKLSMANMISKNSTAYKLGFRILKFLHLTY